MKSTPDPEALPVRSASADADRAVVNGATSVSAVPASVPCADDDAYFDYDDREIGCVNCDGGWRHGCCDDMCIGSNEPEWCEDARPCRTCNPYGEIL